MDTDSEKSWLVFKRFLRKRERKKMREIEKVEGIENERKGIRMVRVIGNDHDREKLENIEKTATNSSFITSSAAVFWFNQL